MIVDHLGQNFKTKKEMCGYWGVSYNVYYKRRATGWKLDEALTTPVKAKVKNSFVTVDHLGNEFKTVKEMCNYWGISLKSYSRRRCVNGLSLEEALTMRRGVGRSSVTDHKGVTYALKRDMAAAYGLHISTLMARLARGWSVERALTENVKEHSNAYNGSGIEGAVVCPDGIKYKDVVAMCKHYGVSTQTFNNRRKRGLSVEQSLSGETVIKGGVVALNGTWFPNLTALCKAQGLDFRHVFARINNGLSLDAALKEGESRKNGSKYKIQKLICPAGVEYAFSTFAKKNNMSWLSLKKKLQEGLSVSEIQEMLESRGGKVICPKGVKYESETKMAAAYGLLAPTYFSRKYKGWATEEALGLIRRGLDYKILNKMQINDLLEIDFDCRFMEKHAEPSYVGRDGRRYYRVTVKLTGQVLFRNSDQILTFKGT
jgi:hypothetical protein